MLAKSFRSVSLLGLTLGLAALAGAAQAQTVIYSNIDNYTGSVFRNQGATTATPAARLVADDIDFVAGSAGAKVTDVVFSVYNRNATATSARALLRFYADNGTNFGPGTLLGSVNLAPIAFAGSSLQLFEYTNNAGIFTVPADEFVWAGLTFDNTGATTTTAAQLNNLGQLLFNPPTVGGSADIFFLSTAGGTFTGNNPAGSFTFFGGNPVASLGWQFSAVPEPGLLGFSLAFGVAGSGLLARRKMRASA